MGSTTIQSIKYAKIAAITILSALAVLFISGIVMGGGDSDYNLVRSQFESSSGLVTTFELGLFELILIMPNLLALGFLAYVYQKADMDEKTKLTMILGMCAAIITALFYIVYCYKTTETVWTVIFLLFGLGVPLKGYVYVRISKQVVIQKFKTYTMIVGVSTLVFALVLCVVVILDTLEKETSLNLSPGLATLLSTIFVISIACVAIVKAILCISVTRYKLPNSEQMG